jgi:replicative DNA helicase
LNGEGRPGGTETAHQPAKTDSHSVRQIPPVGPHPTAGVLLLGASFWASHADAAEVLELVLDADMPSPSLAIVLAAVRRLVARGTPPGPQLVADELRRVGTLKHFAAKDLQDATTCGAQSLAIREYAAAVVSESLRRLIDSAAAALQAAAVECAEDELAPMVARATQSATDCAQRLRHLRGDAG